MRFHRLALLACAASLAAPAIAQTPTIERRIGKIEQDLRAVQRRVFPNGNVEPEIRPDSGLADPIGVPATSAVADLTARVDSLEAQLARLTNQVEESGFRVRQIEEEVRRLRDEAEARRAEAAAAAAAAAPPPLPEADVSPAPPSTGASVDAPDTGDPAEDAYLAGFRLWDQGRYADARQLLEPVATKWPKHRRASWAQNLLGRAWLDDGKPANAAKVFLANYQSNPKGERAADSLYFLGQALVALKRPAEACKVYDELGDVYGTGMRDWLKQRLPKARADAKCG